MRYLIKILTCAAPAFVIAYIAYVYGAPYWAAYLGGVIMYFQLMDSHDVRALFDEEES